MPSVYDLKPKFQNLLRPAVNGLARVGVTANQVTVAAMVLSFGTGAALTLNPGDTRWALLLPLTLFLRMALNAVDGMLAREHGMKTPKGALLNELGDVFSDTALYAPFALWPSFSGPFMIGVVILSILSEMTGVLAVQIGVARRYDGPMGKSDRAFWIGLLTLLLGLGVPVGRWITVAQGLIIILLVQTIWNRAKRALAEVDR
jgi:CDP-diacylglycerol--glycerol-3-phosphate 3-phosphatidyltransferase